MYNPLSTYRIQFNKDFTFNDLERILPYLQQLGVGTVYASPIFKAVPGSTHGYDGLNPNEINPEVGTEEQLKELTRRLRVEGIGWLQDIVPNHMAFHPGNEWLMDVLEKGLQSPYASYFDIGWNSSLYKGRVMVPFLGAPLETVIQNGELKIAFDHDRFVLRYYDSAYPLNPRSYATILQGGKGKKPEAVAQLLQQMQPMHQIEDAKEYSGRWHEFRLQLASLAKNEVVNKYISSRLHEINHDAARLQQVADEQVYRLCHWQETDFRINYRRFFTVNGLMCMNMQHPEVFQHYHLLIKQLLEEGVFQGLRVDHIDGLYDPTAYLQQLRQLAGDDAFIVVEKILEPNEGMPACWPIEGNSGYDFLHIVNNLFTNKESEEAFTYFYEGLAEDSDALETQIRKKKSYILHHHMRGELENLFRLFMDSNLVEKKKLAAIHHDDIKDAIAEFLIHCPVYRFYGNHFPLPEEEARAVAQILHAMKRRGAAEAEAVDVLERVLLHQPHHQSEEQNKKVQHFYQRCMQFTGPLMAKGVEDTLMYTYHRFIGHNEVGDSPEAFGFTPDEFHQKMQARQEQWPLSLNATSTHDTKRGEDVRARLNVLTDLAGEWLQRVKEWQQLNAPLKQNGAPDANDEYFIYQTLIGAYPFGGDSNNFENRIQEYLQKALREAKVHSNWTTPNEQYESAAKAFALALLDQNKPFWKSFSAFYKKVADHGIVNSLAQVVLKFTCPGTPDVYQGCELWDFSLVDPDNRRPVDYKKRQQWLQEINEAENTDELLQRLWQNRESAQIKLWLVHTLMRLRRQQPDLFLQGDYLPLKVEGAYKNHVLAFARRHRKSWLVVAVPLHTAQLCEEQGKDILALDWKDTRITGLQEVTGLWEHLVTTAEGKSERGIAVKEIFRQVPVALLRMQGVANERGAGILLHITSLPTPFGIGDMGPSAKAFADFLRRSQQKYWQLLPLNPTEAGQGHSPYSAVSSRAGNPLLLSPELLVKDGLLRPEELHPYHLPQTDKVDYAAAEAAKKELFQKAWEAYRSGKGAHLKASFEDFCIREAAWLDDFALYIALKKEHNGQPWFAWPQPQKLRLQKALQQTAQKHREEIGKTKWLQFLFSRQWHALKEYCNSRNIQLLGDMPIYVSYDSADVWANPEIFNLDAEGNIQGIAGTPPDAFSDEGQLWGMPVFKWDKLKEQNYEWWLQRLRKNVELFDLVRLDHFRAFAGYWEVPAGEQSAKNGQWKPGPGANFFQTVQEQLGELPFVAEDLGEITDDVYQLRDAFHLPGMKVLQFAFSEDLPQSPHIPHNYTQNFIAYTGTHDNNTIRGWYRHEAGEEQRSRVQQYLGRPVSDEEVHYALGRLAYSSVARMVILPLQDVLGLDEQARMNTPAAGENNWAWRLHPGQINVHIEHLLREWVWLYNRG